MKIFLKITQAFQEKQPFVVYKKPNSTSIQSFFQKNNDLFFLDDYNDSGFVFAPFDSEKRAVFFSRHQSDFFEEALSIDEPMNSSKNAFDDDSQKENHLKIVEKSINEIQKGMLKKVVISRKKLVQLPHFQLVEVFRKLLCHYQNAFVYVWFHPKIGLWLGATPETLLTLSNRRFETMSLAGTQVAEDLAAVVWQQKELEEQFLVTNFIENQLNNKVQNLQITGPETIKAGNLYHLRTLISGTLPVSESSLKELIESLHPTPAICGLPRNAAKKFILDNENYQREFYTGFLGELNMISEDTKSKRTHLFVNLRCMKIEHNVANIFIGGGITKDSNPQKEWQETVFKSNIMKAVL